MNAPHDAPELPGVLAEVARVAGRGAALHLAFALGGTHVYIGRSPGPDSLLARAVGLEAARRIGAALGGETVEVPLGPATDHRRQRAEIRKRLADGESVQQIARELSCTRRTVQRVKLELAAGEQPDLFAGASK